MPCAFGHLCVGVFLIFLGAAPLVAARLGRLMRLLRFMDERGLGRQRV